MIHRSNKRRILAKNGLDKAKALKIVKQIEMGDYEVIDVLKDHPRSKVSRIRLNDLELVLKVPREKNRKTWIRFLTLFRKSEVFKNLLGMKLLNTSGFKTTKSFMACEYRNWGMVTDSWLLYYYLDGEECLDRKDTFVAVVELLQNMHSKNILHGDAQIRNFITCGPELYVIDANPKKSRSPFAKAYEMAYLKRSQPELEHLISKTIYYDLAVRFDRFDRKLALIRRSFKKTIGLSR